MLAARPIVARAGGVTGRVVDPDGRPVSGATVLVDGPLGTRTVRADDQGHFAIALDDRTTYRVLVQAPGFIADPVTVRGSETSTPLTIALRIAPISDAVVVLASQVPRPLSEAPSTSTVIDRHEIEARQLETVSDALRTLPGFTVARSGGRGALTSVFPRGGESDYTLVFVDGLQVNAFGGGLDFSLLPFGDVAQVETISGPQSALFGSNAIGGIVQVTTRQGGPATASATFEGGSQALFHARAGGAADARRVVVRRRPRALLDRRLHRDRARLGRNGLERRLAPHERGGQPRLDARRRDGVARHRAVDGADRGNPGPYGSIRLPCSPA